jgi:hypothetical protein
VSRGRGFTAVAALVVALSLASCSGSSRSADSPATTAGPARRDVLVSIGSNATFGDGLDNPLRDAWPQRLFHDAFPRSTVLVNASDRLVTVGRALGQPLSIALEVHATVVAVWLGDLDLATGVAAPIFEADLDRLVKQLRASGARVLLGNLSLAQPGAAAYDDAIARVAQARGATPVDIATALSSHAGIAPSTDIGPDASRAVADAFAAAVTSGGASR